MARAKAKQQNQTMPMVPKDSDGFLDMTGVDSPQFKFRYQTTNDEGKTVDVRETRDVQWVLIQLKQNLPTAFQASSDGKSINLVEVFRLFSEGKPIPAHLPQLAQIVVAARHALELPDDFGTKPTMVLLQMFLVELVRLDAVKKGQPDSQG